MNLEEFRTYCLNKKDATEEFPFGEEVMVFKVQGKIFALCGVDPFDSVNLKCDPEKSISLREAYAAVQPGYHMNKKHWNTILMDGSIPNRLLFEWLDHSYALVAPKAAKTKKLR